MCCCLWPDTNRAESGRLQQASTAGANPTAVDSYGSLADPAQLELSHAQGYVALTDVGLVQHDVMAWHHLGCASQAAVGVHCIGAAWQGQSLDSHWLGRCGWACKGAALRASNAAL